MNPALLQKGWMNWATKDKQMPKRLNEPDQRRNKEYRIRKKTIIIYPVECEAYSIGTELTDETL